MIDKPAPSLAPSTQSSQQESGIDLYRPLQTLLGYECRSSKQSIAATRPAAANAAGVSAVANESHSVISVC